MEQVLSYVGDEKLKNIINNYNHQHIKIGDECHNLLSKYGSNEKDPQPMAKAMSFISTEIKMMSDNKTRKAAEIMMDGCNMGIKSVSSYINQYSHADNESMKLANKIVKLEQSFIDELRDFL